MMAEAQTGSGQIDSETPIVSIAAKSGASVTPSCRSGQSVR
jgi:hypothetical protein